MGRFKFYIASAVLCTLVVVGECKMTTEPPVTITVPTKPPTTSSSTTHAPDTTTAAPNTTTSSTTTTPAPNTTTSTTTTSTTTTPAPNTTTSTTTTTTPPPDTTTTPKPTPAPTPKPPTPPEQGIWSYTDKNNITCIVVQFAAQFNVTYNKNDSSNLSHILFNLPVNATVAAGNCNGTEQWLQMSWPAVDGGATLNNLTLFYHKNESTKYYMLQSLNVSLAREAIPDASSESINLWHGAEWQTPLATSYRCGAPTQLNMTGGDKNVVAALTMSRLQEEAFRTGAGKGFSAARECGGGDVPDAVPIAVGCALGGLVLVVLVAYILARRRSAARGYLSM